MKNKLISVITIAFNNYNEIRNEINSIHKYNDLGDQLEVIVVDHSEPSGIKDLEKEFRDVIFLKHENKGFGSGNNFGASFAHGEVLCFLNPDTLLMEPVFSDIVNFFHSNGTIGIIGTQLLSRDMRKNMSFYYIDRNDFISKQLIKFANAKGIFNASKMYISGANLFIRNNLFHEAGMFDENMFMYYEEPDLTKRVSEIGYTSMFLGAKHIIHLEGKRSTPSLTISKRKYNSAKYYFKKYGLDYRKMLRQDYRYNKLKYIFGKIKGSSDKHEYKARCDYIKNELRNCQDEQE